MIAEIERKIRAQLGDVVFGVDEDQLEDVVLKEVAKRGWTLVGVESGLDGLLARKIPRAISIPDLTPDSLMAALRAARADANADVALGVAMYLEERAAAGHRPEARAGDERQESIAPILVERGDIAAPRIAANRVGAFRKTFTVNRKVHAGRWVAIACQRGCRIKAAGRRRRHGRS